jgi:hypothetical protein
MLIGAETARKSGERPEGHQPTLQGSCLSTRSRQPTSSLGEGAGEANRERDGHTSGDFPVGNTGETQRHSQEEAVDVKHAIGDMGVVVIVVLFIRRPVVMVVGSPGIWKGELVTSVSMAVHRGTTGAP